MGNGEMGNSEMGNGEVDSHPFYRLNESPCCHPSDSINGLNNSRLNITK